MLDREGWSDQATEKEKKELTAILRRTQVSRSINVSDAERAVAAVLLVDKRPITASSLSDLTGYSRKTVRAAVRDLETMGLSTDAEHGWCLTNLGRRVLLRFYRETNAVAKGKMKGYSEEFLSVLRSLPTKGVSRPFIVDP